MKKYNFSVEHSKNKGSDDLGRGSDELGRSSNELGRARGSNNLGKGSNELGKGSNMLGRGSKGRTLKVKVGPTDRLIGRVSRDKNGKSRISFNH